MTTHLRYGVPLDGIYKVGGIMTMSTESVFGQSFNVNEVDVKTDIAVNIDGYRGQIINAGQIVWESRPYKTADKAKRAAQRHVADRVADLFAD